MGSGTEGAVVAAATARVEAAGAAAVSSDLLSLVRHPPPARATAGKSASAWRRVKPVYMGSNIPYLPVVSVAATAPTVEPAEAARSLSPGDICPVCHAEVRERALFTGSFIGCRC